MGITQDKRAEWSEKSFSNRHFQAGCGSLEAMIHFPSDSGPFACAGVSARHCWHYVHYHIDHETMGASHFLISLKSAARLENFSATFALWADIFWLCARFFFSLFLRDIARRVDEVKEIKKQNEARAGGV